MRLHPKAQRKKVGAVSGYTIMRNFEYPSSMHIGIVRFLIRVNGNSIQNSACSNREYSPSSDFTCFIKCLTYLLKSVFH